MRKVYPGDYTIGSPDWQLAAVTLVTTVLLAACAPEEPIAVPTASEVASDTLALTQIELPSGFQPGLYFDAGPWGAVMALSRSDARELMRWRRNSGPGHLTAPAFCDARSPCDLYDAGASKILVSRHANDGSAVVYDPREDTRERISWPVTPGGQAAQAFPIPLHGLVTLKQGLIGSDVLYLPHGESSWRTLGEVPTSSSELRYAFAAADEEHIYLVGVRTDASGAGFLRTVRLRKDGSGVLRLASAALPRVSMASPRDYALAGAADTSALAVYATVGDSILAFKYEAPGKSEPSVPRRLQLPHGLREIDVLTRQQSGSRQRVGPLVEGRTGGADATVYRVWPTVAGPAATLPGVPGTSMLQTVGGVRAGEIWASFGNFVGASSLDGTSRFRRVSVGPAAGVAHVKALHVQGDSVYALLSGRRPGSSGTAYFFGVAAID